MSCDFGDPLTNSQMEACAVLVMRMMLEDLSKESGEEFAVLLERFASSNTYNVLFDFSTRLWAEGPDYLYWQWRQEVLRCSEER